LNEDPWAYVEIKKLVGGYNNDKNPHTKVLDQSLTLVYIYSAAAGNFVVLLLHCLIGIGNIIFPNLEIS